MIIWKRWCCWLLVEVFLHQLYATSSITRVDRFLVWVVTAFGFGRGIQCNKYGRSYVCRFIWSILTNTQINPSSKRQIIQRLGSQLNNTEITWQQQVVWCRASQMSPAGQSHPKCPQPVNRISKKSWGLLVPPWTWAARIYALCSQGKSYHYSQDEKAIQHASLVSHPCKGVLSVEESHGKHIGRRG
jgi:hypothetical protein